MVKHHKQSGFMLILAVLILAFFSILIIVAMQIFGIRVYQLVDAQHSGQAQFLAQAGLEWYMEKLEDSSDWLTDGTPEAFRKLAPGYFEVQTSDLSETAVTIKILGKITAESGVIQRSINAQLWKLPKAFRLALFKGYDSNLLLFNNSTLTGNMYNQRNVTVLAGCTIQGGKAYVPSGYTVSGAGSIASWEALSSPTPGPGVPALTTTYYDNLISAYDVLINNAWGWPNLNLPTGTYTLSGIRYCNNLTTNGNVTVTGTGTVACWGYAQLPASGTLTIVPSGGPITILARRNINLAGSGANSNSISGPVTFYTRNILSAYGPNCHISDALMMSSYSTGFGANVNMYNQAQVSNSTIYTRPAPALWVLNRVDINGSGTVFGNVILAQNSLYIRNQARVNGLVYCNRNTLIGTYLNNADIYGSLVSDYYWLNFIGRGRVTYDAAQFPDPPPRGFENMIMLKPFSWDGN